MGNMTEVEATTVPAEVKVKEPSEEGDGGGDETEKVEETMAAEEEATNEVDGDDAVAAGTVEEEVTNEEKEAADKAKAAQEEDAHDTERKRNTKKRRKDPPVRESKRVRKSTEVCAPVLFSNKGKEGKVSAGKVSAKGKVTIIRGRGSRLGSIPNVKKSIESLSDTSEDLYVAHRLVFAFPGKPGKDDYMFRKKQLLAFSGYLTPIEDGEDPDDRATIDEKAETKMSFKAYKMSIPSLTSVCRVFDVDISSEAEGNITKDGLIDLLLDFLGAPDVELTNANKENPENPKHTSLDHLKEVEDSRHVNEAEPKAKVSGEEETEKGEEKLVKQKDEGALDVELTNANEETDEKPKPTSLDQTKEKEDSIQVDEAKQKVSGEEETEKAEERVEDTKGEEEVGETKLPSDKALRKWVRAYVACFNMERATIRHALDTVSDKFGVDLTPKKARIKEFLVEEY